MSKKIRHATFVIISIIAILTLTYVAIKFFTNDKSYTPVAKLEEETFIDESIEVIEVIAPEESLSSSQEIEQDELKDTNEIETNTIDDSKKVSTTTKPTSTSRSTIDRKSSQSPTVEVDGQEQIQQEEVKPVETSQISTNPDSIGTISIPKTGVNLPILKKVTVSGMEVAACYLYSTGSLNRSGTTIIVGHNYNNGKLFSNNKNLQIGDVIYVTTSDETQIQYTIYEKIITSEEDLSYLDRNTTGQAEIALSTCADNNIDRLVILAK